MADKPEKQERDYFLEGSQKTRKVDVAYTDFVRKMRLILPILAVAVVAVLLIWSGDQDSIIVEEQQAEEQQYERYQTVQQNELLNPRFESVDGNNNPYTVTADRALQKENNENVVILEKPRANIQLNAESWLSIQANYGEYEQELQNIKLEDDVRLFHDSGHQIFAMDFMFEKASNRGWTKQPIHGSGPDGSIRATGVNIDQNDKQILFNGPAKLVLNNAGILDLEPPTSNDIPAVSDITEEGEAQ